MSTSFDVSDDFSIDDDTLHEECGVFGILGHPDAAALTALGLHALQHRGQEAAGIVSYDGPCTLPSRVNVKKTISHDEPLQTSHPKFRPRLTLETSRRRSGPYKTPTFPLQA